MFEDFFLKKQYYVLEKDNVFVAFLIEERFPTFYPYYIRDLLDQGFQFYDWYKNLASNYVYAQNLQDAIDQAKKEKDKDINKLHEQIKKLESEKGFVVNKETAYQVFNVDKNASLNEIKEKKNNLLRLFHPDLQKGDTTKGSFSDMLTKIINEAWDLIGK